MEYILENCLASFGTGSVGNLILKTKPKQYQLENLSKQLLSKKIEVDPKCHQIRSFINVLPHHFRLSKGIGSKNHLFLTVRIEKDE